MKPGREAAAGNPCPFLRALVGEGLLRDDAQPTAEVAATIVRVARAGEGSPALPAAAIRAIALISHGLGPLAVARTAREGVRPGGLRGGPLDKRGVGSGVLAQDGRTDADALERLAGFASPKTAADGSVEPGLDLRELTRFMDANLERAAGRHRRLDRKLMDGEWPVLLKVLGKDGPGGRYLAVDEVKALVSTRRLPARMRERLGL